VSQLKTKVMSCKNEAKPDHVCKCGKVNNQVPDNLIIGVVGQKRNGKDTFANVLVDKFGFTKESFAKPIKDACKSIFGFTEEQVNGDLKEVLDDYWGVTPRHIMQIFGTELFQIDLPKHITQSTSKIDKTIWVNSLKKRITEGRYVIADVRFIHEVEAIREAGGVIVKVVRPDMVTNNQDLHPSEMELLKIDADYVIFNDTAIEEFRLRVEEVYKDIVNNCC